MKVHCKMCDSMVPAYDAARVTRHREAERAVMEAAKVMADHIGQPPTTNCYNEWMVARDVLLAAVATLREQEAET